MLFRVAHIVTNREEEVNSEPWCFTLFSRQHRLLMVLVVLILFPFFTVWVLLGTLWYAEAKASDECFRDQQEGWYFVLWLVIFYLWLTGYNTAIIISAVVFCRERAAYSEYFELVEQYGESVPPVPHFSIEGLSPRMIQHFEVQTGLGDGVCSVCLEDLQVDERVRVLPCKHRFHLGCIDGWLMRQHWCPNCKRDLRISLS